MTYLPYYECKIVHATSLKFMEELLNEALKDGWALQGTVTDSFEGIYMQVVTRFARKEGESAHLS